MKCPDIACGFETKDIIKFCPECGTRLVSTSVKTVVLCPGTTEDGSPCKTELNPSHKFCTNCGTKVDPQLFTEQEDKCKRCGTACHGTEAFCGECGLKRGQLLESAQEQNQGEAALYSSKFDKNERMEERQTNAKAQKNSGQVNQITTVIHPNIPSDTNKDNERNESFDNIEPDEGKTDSDPENGTATSVTSMEDELVDTGSESKAMDTAESPVYTDPKDDQLPAEFHTAAVVFSKKDFTTDNNIHKSKVNTLKDTSLPEKKNNQEAGETGVIFFSNVPGNNHMETEINESENESKGGNVDNNHYKRHTESSLSKRGGDVDRDFESGDQSEEMKGRSGQKRTHESVTAETTGSGGKLFKEIGSQMQSNNHSKDMKMKGESRTFQKPTHEVVTEDTKLLEATKMQGQSNNKPGEDETDHDSIGNDFSNNNNSNFVFGTGVKEENHACRQSSDQSPSESYLNTDISTDLGVGTKAKPTHEVVTEETKLLEATKMQGQSNNKPGEDETDRDCIGNDFSNNNNSNFVFGTGVKEENHACKQSSDQSPSESYLNTDISTDLGVGTKAKKGKSYIPNFVKGLFGFGNKDGRTEDDKADVETKKAKYEDQIRNPDQESSQDHEKLPKSQKKNRKNANKDEQQSGADKKKLLDHGKTKTSPSDVSEKLLTVHFHVFVSEDFDFDPERQKVLLIIGNEELGGWNEKSRLLSIKRIFKEEKVYEMEYSMKIPARIVTNNNFLIYKYCILEQKSKQTKDSYHYIWENYMVDHRTGEGVNRTLAIWAKWKKLENWHQYDGFMEKEQQKWFASFTYWKKKLRAHAEISLQACCESIFEHELVDLSICEKIEILFHAHWKVYGQDAKCWGNISKKQFAKEFGGHLIKCLLSAIPSAASNKNAQEMLETRVIMALSCLYMKKNLGIEHIDKERTHTLCRALLMEKEDEPNKCNKLVIAEQLFPGEKRKKLLEAIIEFARGIASNTKDPSWLFVMPWIHFLSGRVKPYDAVEMDLSHDELIPKWWGSNDVKESVEYFKAKTSPWAIPIEEVLNTIERLFCMDYLLPRTFMSCIELKNLNEVINTIRIPLEVVLATLVYFIRKTRPRYEWTYNYMTTDEKKLSEGLSCLCKHIEEYANGESEELLEMRCRISKQLLEESCIADRPDIMSKCTQIFLHCIAVYDKYVGALEKQTEAKFEHASVLFSSLDTVLFWMKGNSYRWNQYLKDNLQIWDSLVATQQLPSEKIRDMWNQRICYALSNTLKTEVCNDRYIMADFVGLYCRSADTFKSALQECLSTAAFQSIRAGYLINYSSFTEDQTRRFGWLLSGLFTSEWDKVVSSGDEDKTILRHALTWPPFLQFMKINYTDAKMAKLLSEECMVMLVKADSFIENVVLGLVSGEVTIGNLNMISENEAKFVELVEILNIGKTHTKDFLSKVIKIRQREIKAFRDQAQLVTTFTSLCSQLPVDVSRLYGTLHKLKNIEVHQVREFCHPVDVRKVLEDKAFTPHLCAFKVPDSVLDILFEMHTCNKSNLFSSFWEKQCNAMKELCNSLESVVEKIWIPVKEGWDVAASSIENGTITFKALESHIGRIYKHDYAGIEHELMSLNIKQSTINKRLDQLKKYRQLGSCVKGAKVILKFKEEYNLEGDFHQIETIAQYDQNYMEMRSFDDGVMKTCDFLKEISDAEAESLKAFVKCEPLVTWLRQSMETGLKELKVFVDLAFMSAGDEPMSIKKVQCLHAAVTGYAPLIFDLKQTADTHETRIDYRELLDICRVVWKELAADPNLAQKLIDTNHNLEWLKDVQKAHGSVEVTSLVQADAINANGIYTVGRRACKDRLDENVESKELASSLKLTVSEIEGKRLNRNYNFENLQDLQSRLMLVAEKGNENVDRFTSIFDSIIRLAIVNNKLCSAGCVLFKDWTARFLCDRKKPVCSILEFGLAEGSPTMKARRSDTEDLVAIIPKIAKFMESCLEEWLKYIKEKRRSYKHLNYFTIDQLVILQRELVKIGTEEHPSVLIYPLLSAVKRNCTPGDLMGAMTHTKQEIEAKEATLGNQELEHLDTSDADDIDDVHVRQTFIKELIEAGFDEKLAIKALDHVEPDQIEDGIVWCMNSEDMDEESPIESAEPEYLYTRQTNSNQEEMPSRWNLSSTSIQSLIASNIETRREPRGSSVDILLEDLQTLWNNFLASISSNINDYLSLEHLGMILENLDARETSRIFRKFPPSFQEGSPNLVICPTADVLSTALSLYVLEEDQELPQPDEILVCTQETTIDEVDIFWRRAMFGGGKKIHCLVHADCLSFDVSDAAEVCLEQYIQETNYTASNYRLVVICGSDNEYKSRVVASLDKHRRPPIPVDPEYLREYVSTKLQVNNLVNGVKPAACVDFNKSSVRLIKSWRAGVGKTLYKSRREQDLARLSGNNVKSDTVTIPLQEKVINLHYVIKRLLDHTTEPGVDVTRIFHIDIANEVQEGVDYLLFNLLVLGCLTNKKGYVWRKSPSDLYLIETLPLMIPGNRGQREQHVHHMLNILPDVTCRSPQESLNIYDGDGMLHGYNEHDQLFDQRQFQSSTFQRPFQYLYRLDQGRDLNDIQPARVEGTQQLCLKTFLRHCGVEDPSWAEIHHFVWFLNTQLKDFERSAFVGAAAAEDLPGFSTFVLRFLIQMSRDFSTRSLNMSEESPSYKAEIKRIKGEDEEDNEGENENDLLNQFQLRRTWESSPHPYLFFNSDHSSFTFLGFYIDQSGNLIDQQTNQVLERTIMKRNLYASLIANHVPIQENFNQLPRHEKIIKMCNVMGIDLPHDPDDTYELTTDNVKKIMAIFMRFRCDIPVIIMGETGCGKTRLVKFMCRLQVPPGLDNEVQNMILMKVHGGTTNSDIIRKVREAERMAETNVKKFGTHMYTVLFFDEANTTESIGLIKEIMCDKTMEGEKLTLCKNLKMVAACNPYRKHSEELIKKLEKAGLGYHVDADNTMDKLGRVPMRRLVYRVQPLPQSLLPLVWDFGQLNLEVEDLYIRQMVKRYIRDNHLPNVQNLVEVVSAILTASQDYMRAQKNECSFVSLRDVDRALGVMSWFYAQSQDERTLFFEMDNIIDGLEEQSDEEEMDEEDIHTSNRIDDLTRSLVLSLGVCYHACLKTREQYREHVAPYFKSPCLLPGGADQIEEEISCCQDVFLDNVHLENNIAKNMALKENVFMMVVCIELRIPLFLVGKPGSSKSLAKTIVSDAMQGNASRETLFKELKQAQMISFQCSPLSTPESIVGTFRQCAQFQKDKDLKTFVSIVVLDEVGLAEDSPRMPLKTLHPLLEDGCQGDEIPEPYMKVSFIGISNWALDPAKMNRGILVQREVPDLEELKNSAKGICSSDENVLHRISPLITPMCQSYLDIFDQASKNMREFFGLRDFYSLVKMVYGFTEKSRQKPTWHEMLHAIKRNFGGLEQEKVDPVEFFKEKLSQIITITKERKPSDPDCSAAGLIEACLFERNNTQGESRYLLLLTESYGSLTILQQQILARQQDIKPVTIFGSSFRSDQEYTQVCRNINKIKVCMETGNTVVLLNLENLYESLYDALNQYYVYFGGERYVDLGLGTHRVKCPVHKKFRLIVVAEKRTVYEKFPIPLINRLEKHFLNINTMLSKEQQRLAKELEKWCIDFISQNAVRKQQGHVSMDKIGNVFMGYHEDTCSAVILHVWRNYAHDNRDEYQILKAGKSLLLWVATPDAVVRLQESRLPPEECKELQEIYHKKQRHESIVEYLHQKLVVDRQEPLFVQVTTHSKLLATFHVKEISKKTGIASERIMLLDTLSSFDTEQQFSNKIQQHLKKSDGPSLLIIQCDSGHMNANLIACARYCVLDEYQKMSEDLSAPVHIVVIVQLPNIAGISYSGFQCGLWQSVHIDDLWIEDMNLPDIDDMQNKSVSSLITEAVRGPVPMETSEADDLGNSMEWQQEQTISRHGQGEEDHESAAMEENVNLDIEDVILDFEIAAETLDKSNEQGYQRRDLNVKALIISCTQAALSMLKDKTENCKRTTERVALVLTLFHGSHLEGYELFLQGMYTVISGLLREKEKHAYGAEQWLTREAARPENIQKAGTFRRSCLQTLESKIAPILAGIIAHLDTNQNLDILNADLSEWKQRLWLAVLNVPDALHLQYADLQSPKRQSDLQEVVIKTTGCEGHAFKAKMPFSWLIWQKVTEIMKTPVPVQDDDEPQSGNILPTQANTATLDWFVPRNDTVAEILWDLHTVTQHCSFKSSDNVSKLFPMIFPDSGIAKATTDDEEKHFYAWVFEKTPIGKVLARINHRDTVTEIADDYLHDFIHMCYRHFSDEEFELVTKSIKYLYNQKLEETGCSTIHQMIVCIHESHKMLAPRLSYFHAMNTVWPECSATIVNLQRENPDHRMFQEEEFTFSALCMLIEHLEPKKNEVDNQDGRSKWLNKVHTFRPIIEKVLRLYREDPDLYGTHSYGTVTKARCLWSRVVVMKMFIEHVCAVETKDKITVKHCMPLWKVLGDSCDLKNLKSMDALERFLKLCNKTAIKEFLGKQEKCQYCEVEIEGLPIIFPCKHLFCDQCYQDTLVMGEKSCLICKHRIPDTWQVARQTETTEEAKKLLEYQRRCNSFFMDVVSQLCFYDNTPPSDEVIDKLLKYIFYTSERCETVQHIKRTKEMTIFDTGLDPNPVFRSFLLQLLMRTSKDQVMENIEKYLNEANVLLQQRDSIKVNIELGLLVIHCLEDIMNQDISRHVEIEEGIRCLRHAKENIFTNKLDVAKLYGLAEARLGLTIAAKVIARLVGQPRLTRIDSNVRKLIEAAQELCENYQTDFPRIYLVKYICRHFGIDIYQAVCNSERRFLMWIRTHEQTEMQRVEISDRFVTCGEVYFKVREALTKVILGEDISHLHETLQELMTSGSSTSIMFPLTVFREITCSFLYPQNQRKVTNKVITVLQKYVQESKDIEDITKDWLLRFLRNTDLNPHLTVKEGSDFRVQGVQSLMIHFLLVILQQNSDNNLCRPFVSLLLSPESNVGTYLPTMPQDDLEEVKEALLAARAADGSENPVFYRCPNGHPYVIGNCGRPATVGICKDCGAVIGGEGYQLRPGNIQHQGRDETQTGHILGPANTRVQGPYAERQMSPLFCAIVRLMLHMSMYLGAISNRQAVQRLIVTGRQDSEIPEFLWQHIFTDLNDLQKGTGKSIDEILVLLHATIDRMMTTQDRGVAAKEEVFRWSSKQGRKEWENLFCEKYLRHTLNDCDTVIQQGNKVIVEDHRLGADPLLCLLYETASQQEEEDPNHLESIAAVWRYRSPVSLLHLRQSFDAASDRFKVLDLFLKEERYLQAIRCIPSILKLQKELFHKYNRKLDKSEASQITIGHIIRDEIAGEETRQLVTDFVTAWDICRETLVHYSCPTELGGMLVQKDYCIPITEETPISILLPAIKEEGLCPYALLDFLMRKQNDVLDKYIKELSKAKKRTPNQHAKVLPMEVTSAHLISYDTEMDLLPLILANCNYSFEIGKGTKIEYDYVNLERQIMDRFLFSKSRIDVGQFLQIDLMVYRAEITNGEVFKKLEEKVPQDDLNAAVKTQICSEMKSLPDLCQSLNNLDIAISFLKSVGGHPDDTLQYFMEQTLHMKHTVHSQKARQSCLFKHIKSLWLLLALEKSKKMAEHKQPIQNIFESVGQEFQEHLPEDMEIEFRDFMRTISVDKLSELVAMLHEFILLKVTVKENRDDEDFDDITSSKLCDWLMAYSDEQDKTMLIQILAGFPATILLKYSIHTWNTAYSMLYEKQTGEQKF